MAEEPKPSTDPAITAGSSVKDDSYFDLPSGKGLSFSSANSLARRYFTRVVLFAGTAQSGKTTLLSTLPLLFHREPFADYLFAGSATLIGFEERNYYVEVASGLVKPNMERTVVPEVLHLQVRSVDPASEHSNLLLCDMSGEDFREAKDSMEVCQGMEIIRRADTFVLLIDGAKLVDPASRQRAKNDPLTLLRNCLDGQMLRPETAVDVLFTKWDLVNAHDKKADIEAFSKIVEDAIKKQFADRIKNLRIARIAAHPFEGELPLGYGLKESFQSWANHRARQISNTEPTPRGKTGYDRFPGHKLSSYAGSEA
jgi:hypothetical protein